jgi:hypothetical protein
MAMFRKVLVGMLFVGSVLWGVGLAAVHVVYASYLPGVPDQTTGHSYRIVVNHGFVRFATIGEAHALQLLENGLPIAIAVFLSAVILGMRWGVVRLRSGRGPKSE